MSFKTEFGLHAVEKAVADKYGYFFSFILGLIRYDAAKSRATFVREFIFMF